MKIPLRRQASCSTTKPTVHGETATLYCLRQVLSRVALSIHGNHLWVLRRRQLRRRRTTPEKKGRHGGCPYRGPTGEDRGRSSELGLGGDGWCGRGHRGCFVKSLMLRSPALKGRSGGPAANRSATGRLRWGLSPARRGGCSPRFVPTRGSGSAGGVSPPRRAVYGESFTARSQRVRNISD